jgi:hypothetical protein
MDSPDEDGAQPSERMICICLYESQSISRYIHYAVSISEALFVRSPVDIDRKGRRKRRPFFVGRPG